MQVRRGSCVFRTQPMGHEFDMPLQLAAVPEHAGATDHASNAFLARLPLQQGDVLVAASDGMWDALWQDEILALLRQHPDDASQVRSPVGAIAGMQAHASAELLCSQRLARWLSDKACALRSSPG